jgi:hypothetical protein
VASGLVIGACKRVEFLRLVETLTRMYSKHIRSMGIAGKAHSHKSSNFG